MTPLAACLRICVVFAALWTSRVHHGCNNLDQSIKIPPTLPCAHQTDVALDAWARPRCPAPSRLTWPWTRGSCNNLNQSTNQPTNQPINQPTNQPTTQLLPCALQTDVALDAWKLVLTGRFRLLERWTSFVAERQATAGLRIINEDQWRQARACCMSAYVFRV